MDTNKNLLVVFIDIRPAGRQRKAGEELEDLRLMRSYLEIKLIVHNGTFVCVSKSRTALHSCSAVPPTFLEVSLIKLTEILLLSKYA